MADEAKKAGTYVAVGWPYAGFVHGVSGVPDLTRDLSEDPVSDSKLSELRKKAKASGVPLVERSNPQ